jgi:hypothetical protein
MGIKHAAASGAALLAGVAFAVSLAAGALPGNGQSERPVDEGSIPNMQAGHAVRGQAWATELFGRRHNRNLLAAVVSDRNDRRSAA